MRKFLLPFKYALIILAIYQLYIIYKYWGHDDSKVIISIVIFIGCLLLAIFDRIFNEKTNNG